MSFTRILIGSAKKLKRSFRRSLVFVRQIGCSCVSFLITYLANKKNNIQSYQQKHQERWLLISKITLKILEQRHLTTSSLPEVTVQNHVLDSFSQNIYQTPIKSLLSALLSCSTARSFNNSRTVCHFMRNKKSLPKYLIHENSKYQHFLFLKIKQPQKWTNF